MKIYLPVKEINEWGWQHKIASLNDFWRAVTRSGQPFGVNNHPDLNFYPSLGSIAHNGVDIPLSTGTAIYASTNGVITEVSNDPSPSQGLGVVIWDKEQLVKTIYWHNLENKVKIGELIKADDVIALSNNTGLSTGPHLHFGLKQTDLNGNTINRDNGYSGAIDPKPYFIWWDTEMIYELVKADKDIFRIKDGKKDLYLNAKSFTALDGRWSEIKQITQQELDAFPDGDVLIAVGNE